jgi:uncharacterized membrane protein YkoI
MARILFALMLLLAAPAVADDEAAHDRARRALEAGEILPLRDILAAAERDYGGQFIEAELERSHDRWVYEIKVISAEGRLAKLLYDARTGTLLKAKVREGRR